MTDAAAQYSRWLDEIAFGTRTLTLEDFAYWFRYDDNVVYRIDSGHIHNLLEEAMDRLNIDYWTTWKSYEEA